MGDRNTKSGEQLQLLLYEDPAPLLVRCVLELHFSGLVGRWDRGHWLVDRFSGRLDC